MITKRKGEIGDTEINTRIYPDKYFQKGGYNGIKLSDTMPAFNRLREEVYKAGLKEGNEDVLKLSNYYLIKDNYNELYNQLNVNSINLSEFDNNFLLWVLDYTKNNLDEMSLVICEIYNLFQNDELNVLKRVMFQENVLPRVGVAKKLYDEYPFFRQFEALDDGCKKDFLKNIENYVFFLLEILKYSPVFSSKTLKDYRNQQSEYINRVIDNLLILDKLPIRDIFLNVRKNSVGISYFDLTYQPFGEVCDNDDEKAFYKEENMYVDGIFMGDYLMANNHVSVRVDFYSFVMKGIRKIGYYKDLSCNKISSKFDEKVWDIYINKLDFDNSKLPSLEELEITKSSLPSYSLLVYNKELELLKKYLKSAESLLEIANKKIEILSELYPELIYNEESLEEVLSSISNSDGVLNISVKNSGYEKIKK